MIQHPPGRDPAAFVAALKASDPIRAGAVARAMLADRRRLGAQWQSVARFAATELDWPLAIDAMRAFVADEPGVPERRLQLAEMLAQAGRITDAIPILEALVRAQADHAGAHHFLGVALIEIGQRERGVVSLERALSLMPGSGQTWLALANAHSFSSGDARFAAMAACDDAFARAPAAESAAWLYARGKAFDDLGEHGRAFAAFAEGARLVARERRYDAAADRRTALADIAGKIALPLVAAPGSGSGRSLFVTGKPRSGTTLVARILTGHSRVDDGGEVNLLAAAAEATGGGDAAAVRRRCAAGPAGWTGFRARHAALVDGRFAGQGLVVDKSLNTSRLAGLVRVALPDAPLVWLRRDPLDTAWSSFRTYFARGVEWSFDLAAMGAYHALEDRLHAFWADAYGDRLLTLDYQALVDDPDATMTRLLTHCGLTDEPGVRNFHLGGGTVQTASVGQVRRPINRDGIDTAAPYRAQLAPYERAYAQARAELGLPAL